MKRPLITLLIVAMLPSCVGRPPQDATGEEIYLQLCANCHGEEMEGGLGPALGPGTNAAGQSHEFLVATITQGRGRMPSFSTTLTDDQVDLLVDFLREVQSG